MDIKQDTVKYVAHLARIDLDEKELELLCGQLKEILDFIDQLNEVELKDIAPTSHILSLKNVLRDDTCRASLPLEKVLQNAPKKEDNFFEVPKVIE